MSIFFRQMAAVARATCGKAGSWNKDQLWTLLQLHQGAKKMKIISASVVALMASMVLGTSASAATPALCPIQ
jgi:hypothetical protein